MAGRPVGTFLQVLALFVAAVVVARLVLDKANGWVFFAILLPVLFVVGTLTLGWLRALVLVALFAVLVVGIRLILTTPKLGWSFVVLGVVVAFSAFVASRVALRLWQDRRQA